MYIFSLILSPIPVCPYSRFVCLNCVRHTPYSDSIPYSPIYLSFNIFSKLSCILLGIVLVQAIFIVHVFAPICIDAVRILYVLMATRRVFPVPLSIYFAYSYIFFRFSQLCFLSTAFFNQQSWLVVQSMASEHFCTNSIVCHQSVANQMQVRYTRAIASFMHSCG